MDGRLSSIVHLSIRCDDNSSSKNKHVIFQAPEERISHYNRTYSRTRRRRTEFHLQQLLPVTPSISIHLSIVCPPPRGKRSDDGETRARPGRNGEETKDCDNERVVEERQPLYHQIGEESNPTVVN